MRLIRFIAASTVAVLFAIPAYAATPTKPVGQCWCTSNAGATLDKSVTELPACRLACNTKGERMIVFATNPSEYPQNNLKCFDTEASCKLNCDGPPSTDKNRTPSGYIWDSENQPPECVGGEKSGHYCYCTGEAYKLAFEIPGREKGDPPVVSVTDIGGYVNTVYKFLLGFGITIGIVMVMIGGLQYVLAAGGGNVKQAKERIENAVVGLILLFCAALILQTVNPRLLTLQPPRLASIKRIEIIEPGIDCKSLKDKGFVLRGDGTDGGEGKQKCGSKETIDKDKNGTQQPDGTSCTWKDCKHKPGTGCFVSVDKGYCLKCEEIVEDAAETRIVPSESACSELSTTDRAADVTVLTKTYCGFVGVDTQKCVSNLLYCAVIVAMGVENKCLPATVNCTGVTTCSGYSGNFSTEFLCANDPCEVKSRPGSKGCAYVPPPAAGDVVNFAEAQCISAE